MSGALAAMILGEGGADVVKVESPEGDWARATQGFAFWNRGKRSIVANLDDPADLDVVRQLATTADVVIDALGGGVPERLGLTEAALRAANPALVHCRITGGGPAEPIADIASYDAVVSAALGRFVGLDNLSGAAADQDRAAPLFSAAPVASYGAAQLAVQGVLAALSARASSGVGDCVSTSLYEGAVAFLMREEFARGPVGEVASLRPESYRGIQMCFLTAECADGRFIQMCARQDHHFRDWLTAVGLAELLQTPTYAKAPLGIERMDDVIALENMLKAKMKERTQAEWMEMFTTQYDVGGDPFLTPAEFLRHPQIVENNRAVEVDDAAFGHTLQLGPLAELDETPCTIVAGAPLLGRHTDEVKAELAGRTVPAPSQAAPSAPRLPLEGVTVLEVAYMIAGPFSATVLAELGARVIKVEPFEGDPYRRIGLQAVKFLFGKESIAVDLKSEAGRKIIHELIAKSDILIENFRPGVADRLGFGPEEALAVNPELVYVQARSYGSRGPQAKRPAFHSTPTALSGGGILQAGRGNVPVDDSYPDAGSGLGAGTAAMLGLLARRQTGRGQRVESTMLVSAGYILSEHMVDYPGKPAMLVPDHGQHGLHALYRLYQLGDEWLFLGALRDREWRAAAQVLGLAELVDDPAFATSDDRIRNDAQLVARIQDALAAKGAAEWVAEFRALGVPAVRPYDQTFEKWLIEHELVLPEEHPAVGMYWRLPPKIRMSAPPRLGRVNSIGEATRRLLAELGYQDDDIDSLVSSGAVLESASDADA
jgi:crotonobetainyl-CoA:carnitine CoA-transferase CaiB-like acyl-CoA transferase